MCLSCLFWLTALAVSKLGWLKISPAKHSLSSVVKPAPRNLGVQMGQALSEPGPARQQFGSILFPPFKEHS